MEIGHTESFTPQKDIFGRKEFGDKLTRIVATLGSPSVLLLDAPWGTGKTTFVKMWRGELSKAGIPSIYFDAFANDYQEDAFLAVASQIIAEAESQAPRKAKAIMAALRYCDREADPSLGIRNSAPAPRAALWREGEVVRLVKAAWRAGYRGLAAAIATSWDTQLSPVDVRQLTAAQSIRDGRGLAFMIDRAQDRPRRRRDAERPRSSNR